MIPKGYNQNLYIEDGQTTQWPKVKVQKDKQRSTKHTHETKDRVTRIPLQTWGELRCSGRVSRSCSTSVTRRVNPVTNPVISHECEKYQEVFTTSGTHRWSFVTQIFHKDKLRLKVILMTYTSYLCSDNNCLWAKTTVVISYDIPYVFTVLKSSP